ncbi:hypothetical protein evm_011198 [Chilo suppressalis]|nr:hypothetical protein evm_011198 [Chilo suppressalis]
MVESMVIAEGKDEDGRARWLRRLERRVPGIAWARRYDRVTAAGDAVAGVTLGLTLVPQSIAYAALAELPVQVGLYTSFMGALIYSVLGTVKEVSIGPTSLMALLTLQACRGLPLQYVVLLTFVAGAIVLLMGLLRLGFLVDLISSSVTSGFTSATAVLIVASQLKGALGLSFSADSAWDNLREVCARAHLVRLNDCLLSAVCCTALLLLRKLKDVPAKNPRVRRTLWLVSIARNALVVVGAATFAYCTRDASLVRTSGRVEGGLPTFALPAWSVTQGNTTVHLGGMLQQLGPSLVLLPAVMVVANVAIAKAFTVGGRVDASQEMVTLGVCNMAGSLAGAMPACGAFTRAALAHASGARTPAAALHTGAITILALAFLTEYFCYIPKACLSSVLICAVIFMIDYETVVRLWRWDRRELVVVGITFVASVVWSVEAGVLFGAAAALVLLLLQLHAAPQHHRCIQQGGVSAVVWRPEKALVFFNADRCVTAARRSLRANCSRVLVLDCSTLALLDHPAVQILQRVSDDLKTEGGALVAFNAAHLQRNLAPLQLPSEMLHTTTPEQALNYAIKPASTPAPAPETAPLLDTEKPDPNPA